jgi:hypothetical protein
MLNKWITGITINKAIKMKIGIFFGQMEGFFLNVLPK